MASKWQLLQTPTFRRAVKKLAQPEKADLDAAIKQLLKTPEAGQRKKGDLAYLRVLKFRMNKKPMLLGYSLEEDRLILVLLALGSHEHFYRELKRR